MLKAILKMNRDLSRRAIRRHPKFFIKDSHKDDLGTRVIAICKERRTKLILEVGGIDRPTLEKSPDYTFHGLDIEYREGCSNVYDDFVVQSIENPLSNHYDLIFSYGVLEHVPNNDAALTTIFDALNPGAMTVHYVPNKNHLYAICLRLVGNRLQRVLIKLLFPGSVATTGYPAFFDHCSPAAFEKLLSRIGFQDVEIRPYYRANEYFAFFYPMFLMITAFENLCRRMNWRVFCSGMILFARKPEQSASTQSGNVA